VRHFVTIENKIASVEISLALYRTFGASLFVFVFPDLTVGPILCRAFGPAGRSNHQVLSFETASPEPSAQKQKFKARGEVPKNEPWDGPLRSGLFCAGPSALQAVRITRF
jgi:hypothetical protein